MCLQQYRLGSFSVSASPIPALPPFESNRECDNGYHYHRPAVEAAPLVSENIAANFSALMSDINHNTINNNISEEKASSSSTTNLHNFSQPRPADVICARGRGQWNHPGNRAFRAMIAEHVKEYVTAGTKRDKSNIVRQIAMSLRESGTQIVKQDPETSLWLPISDSACHEKIAQGLRDAKNSPTMKPAATSKKSAAKLGLKKVGGSDDEEMEEDTSIDSDATSGSNVEIDVDMMDIEEMVISSVHVARIMEQAMKDAESRSNDDEVYEIFCRANLYVLDAIKAVTSISEIPSTSFGTQT